jgi:hypothetical protein
MRVRGRPPLYSHDAERPALMALRVPRALEARLRAEASACGRTMTEIVLEALALRWEDVSVTEVLTQVRQQLAQLQRDQVALEERYARLQANATRVSDENHDLRRRHGPLAAELKRVQAELARVQRELDVAHVMLAYKEELQRHLSPAKGAADPSMLRRDLLKLCHPDKWSQGQLATELAHEITVLLNAGRSSTSPRVPRA